jgi:hypothetical protein
MHESLGITLTPANLDAYEHTQLWRCTECGALIDTGGLDLHVVWHDSLDARSPALAGVAVQED